jgi:hypothetical protein
MKTLMSVHPLRRLLLVCLVIAAAGCDRPRASSAANPTILFSKLGQWSGRGNLQTESFNSATGYLRVTWETTNETRPGEGRFKLIVGSSISGRPLMVMVDAKGVGHNVTYLNEDPRTFYALVESSNVDWKFSIDEGFPAVQEKH